jgi:LacI family transcriptional regulator
VSRVLSGRTDLSISPETRARVIEAAEKLGYRPNAAARTLMTGRSGLVGFWMSLQYSRYRGQVLDRMRTLLGATDLTMSVTDVDVEYTTDHSFDRALRVPVDGIIAFDNSASVEVFGRQHDRLAPGTPFVSMGAYWSEAQSFVGVDLRSGAEAAMAHLLGTGRRRIAYLAPTQSDLLTAGPRYEVYHRHVTESGFPSLVIGAEHVSIASVKDALTNFAGAGPMPDAILCMNDDLAIVATFALQALGLRAGHDVALVGFDGIEETEQCPVPITTVRQPVEEMCALTVEFLQAQLRDPEAPLQQRILKPELIIRESSRP